LTTTGISEKLFEHPILFLITGIAIAFLIKKDWLYALIGTPFVCIIVGCIPLAGELCFLLSIIHWALSLFGRGDYYSATVEFLIAGGLFIGILIRNYLLSKLWWS
jgi:hypothetical protein